MTQETQESNTTTSNKLSNRSVFNFEWDNVLRIIGAVTGIVGIAAALLYILGYIQTAQTLNSLGISQGHYWVSLSNEFYLLNGVFPFASFITNIAILLISYLIARAIVQTVWRDMLIKIKRPFVSLSIGVTLAAIFIYTGTPSDGNIIANTNVSLYFFVFFFTGIDILAATFETVFIKDNQQQTLTRYYNLITSTISIIKVIVLGMIIFAMLINSSSDRNYSSCSYLTKKPTSVTIQSVHSLGLEGGTVSADSYIYTGYYLLYTDNTNYYFFNKLDPESLKPKSIIIIQKDAIEAIQLEDKTQPPNWNLTKTCSDLH